MNQFNELILFSTVVLWIYDWSRFQTYDELNPLSSFADESSHPFQLLIVNIIYAENKLDDAYPFTWILALTALNIWTKFLLRLRISKRFGPMFKVILKMVGDLLEFMVLWGFVICTFTCVSTLIFGSTFYMTFFDAVVWYFEASLGNWDAQKFCIKEEVNGSEVTRNPKTCTLGKVYICLFLLVNLVLFLNFVIAILSSTYAHYEDKKLGLYYEVIVAQFPSMEFDDKFGFIPCAQPPLNLMIAPFELLTIFPFSDEFLKSYNQFLCHLLYSIVAICLTFFFMVLNTMWVPLSYVKHTITLIQTLTDADETMDEFDEKLARFVTIVQFIFIGPVMLIIAIPCDTFIFLWNLYTSSNDQEEIDREKIGLKSLELFKVCCAEELKQCRKDTKSSGTLVDFASLNKRL